MTTKDKYTEVPAPYSWEVPSAGDARFTWEYDEGRARLLSLYQKGKDKQWDAQSRIDWTHGRRPDEPDRAARRVPSAVRQPGVGGRRRIASRRDAPAQPSLELLAVPARRAGGDGVRGQDRRGRPGHGREVLRGHPDHGRGPARRGVLAVPAGEDRPGLPDQQEPDRTAGRHPARLALGHALPRHAGPHRRARTRRLRGAA